MSTSRHRVVLAWGLAAVLLAAGAPRTSGAAWSSGAPEPGAGAAAAVARQARPKPPGTPIKAPHLLDKVEWLKGRTHKRFQRGTVYVLDFWTPWQGLSRDALPALKRLRTSHPGERVVFLSIATFDSGSGRPPQVFIDRRPELFDEHLVRDVQSQAWYSFADLCARSTLPGVVIVDRLGEVAWWGSPFDEVEAALDSVLAGDSAGAREMRKARAAAAKDLQQTAEDYVHAYRHELWSRALKLADQLLAGPVRQVMLPRERYQILVHLGRREEAAAFGRTLVESTYAEMEFELDLLAWFIVNSRLDAASRDLDLALLAATKARELSGGRDWSITDTLARVHYHRGELDAAVAVQEESVAQAWSGEERQRAESILQAYKEKRDPPAAPEREDD